MSDISEIYLSIDSCFRVVVLVVGIDSPAVIKPLSAAIRSGSTGWIGRNVGEVIFVGKNWSEQGQI